MTGIRKLLVLPGDHIGPEIIAEALKSLKVLEEERPGFKVQLSYGLIGGASLDKTNNPITEEVLEAALASDAILLGSVGGPEWAHVPGALSPEKGILRLRQRLDAFANIRPCRFCASSLVEQSSLKADVVKGVNFIVVRENCGGAYFGHKIEAEDEASDLWIYRRDEVERCARVSAALARTMAGDDKRPAIVWNADKANVLASGRFWRTVTHDTFQREFPDIELRDQLADSAAMIMVKAPTKLNGVIHTDNTFGDILSDISGGLVGSLGVLPSASVCGIPGERPVKGVYEAVHAKILIENGADVNAKNSILDTPLHTTVNRGHLNRARALIENGADINVKINQHLGSPLHLAIQSEHLDIAKVLIENGADLNAKNSNLDTPLHLAIQREHLDIAKFLIESGADINVKNRYFGSPLHLAIQNGHLDIAKILIENGADTNVKINQHLGSLLHLAIQNEYLDIAKVLIENGADLNVKNQYLETPLHLAIQREHLNIAKFLIENGADINVKNRHFGSPLHTAVKCRLLDIAKILIENGADVNAKNSILDTPLHIAVGRGDLNMIALLLEKGADANKPRRSGHTALTMALQKQLHGVVETLLQAGALIRETIRDQVFSEQNVSQGITLEIVMDWDIAYFMENGLSGVEDFRRTVTLTGSVQNAQMMSCEDYVAQTWGDSGLRILDAMIRALKSRTVVTDIFDDQRVRFVLHKGTMRIVAEAPEGKIVDLMEQIAWLGCVFAREQTKSEHGPFLATGSYLISPRSGTYQLRIQSYPLEGYPNESCWTKILRSAILAVGYPVRERREGFGLEIPFPLLLRFADISVCMEYGGGTLLVGPSNILFPSRKLEDGIQWHITDATSAKEAAEVIDQSLDWIRTDNIGQLGEHRAYLGYCSRALVLLGTHELLSSQATSELLSLLPKSKSRIEMAHEGTMSAGFSIRGIFNTTVGGKWTLPPRLNVSLEDNRDLEDLLRAASRRPILVYDHNEDRGWLVPELSLVFHMALTYLHQADVYQRYPLNVQEALPYLTAAVDDGLKVYNLVKDNWNLELYEKIEDGQLKTFGMVIRDFIKDLRKLRTAENIRRIEKGFKLPLFSSRTLRGWDFSELAFKAENIFQREMKWKNGGPKWAMLGDTHDMLVILGSCLGDLVRPDLEKTIVTSGWETTPKGAGLLTATNSCVLQLAQKRILLTVNEMTPKQPSKKLFWYRPTVHPGCNCYNACLSIHEITQNGTKTCTKTQDPRKLEFHGATVFGCANPYHKSLERGAR
ncbi:uncharacterized protein BHQ10_006071 [Talaromyces amestolkiae]|uniref:Isopropylmalate dehydrogenase-like domain-containing protein n=1 Tax=Talaromyces amestolkiae TaxID=1196081 RepID=A0A364L2M2_TALAM|nr:uncharacterized protein BHQ10_006071 [Talaromyces amestolkiae]RAO70059.1 hypothetical protein BHQ10_006071 [Talaromyces amestolkiae]